MLGGIPDCAVEQLNSGVFQSTFPMRGVMLLLL